MSNLSTTTFWLGSVIGFGLVFSLLRGFYEKPKATSELEKCAGRNLAEIPFSSVAAGIEGDPMGEDRFQQQLLLCLWLQEANLLHHATKLKELGLNRLEDAYWLEDGPVERFLGADVKLWSEARHLLPTDPQGLHRLKIALLHKSTQKMSTDSSVWLCFRLLDPILRFLARELKGLAVFSMGVGGVIFGLGVAGYLWPSLDSGQRSIHRLFSVSIKQNLLQWLSGQQALANNAQITFNWKEPSPVGNTVSFTLKFFQRSGRPYPISDGDQLRIDVRQGVNKIAVAVELGGADPLSVNCVKVTFTVRKAGQYYVYASLANISIKGSPFVKNFIPGPPDASKTSIVRPTSMVVCTAGVPHQLQLEPRDEFGNPCSWAHDAAVQQQEMDAFTLRAYKVGTKELVHPLVHSLWVEVMHRLLMHVTFQENGVHLLRVRHNEQMLHKGELNVIVLTRAEAALIEKTIAARSIPVTYEARLVSLNGEQLTKAKKVFCAVSPKQLCIKEYIFGFFPKRLATFRLCPSTKFQFDGASSLHQGDVLIIDDGSQTRVELITKEAHLLAATFTHFLLKNIGGSETFKDKQDFFYQEIRKHHLKRVHDKIPIRVDRFRLVETSYKATKSFSSADWCKNFEISFIGEEGLDWGGLRREWIELLCVSLFDPRHTKLFLAFSNDAQALVHPNPRPPAPYKLKHYEFAGKLVGKCLYESSLGPTYRQLVKARFTRSFLAQLIGLRVQYKYFESDDPEYYLSKIKFIEENDITDMDMTFSEEEYDQSGHLLRIVELVPGGSRIKVTNENKFRYLDALAQHKLVNAVKEQMDAFVHGLNELVPDNLLSIFDENELELLMCGTSEYSVADLRSHHVAVGSTPEFHKVLSWFWTALTNFSPEEMSKLLQFATGSSQLPPGGVAELSPKFQIVAAPTSGTLPTAHTCFNQLCLPDYDNYEQFEKALLLAINEGNEGFGLA